MAYKSVLVTGAFDILHRGHVELLTRSAKLADKLYIGLSSDVTIRKRKGNDLPINSYDDRSKLLLSMSCVHCIYPITGLKHEGIMQCTYELVDRLKPDIIVGGFDRSADDFMKPLVDKFSWLTYLIMYHGFEDIHSTDIIKKIRRK